MRFVTIQMFKIVPNLSERPHLGNIKFQPEIIEPITDCFNVDSP